MTADVAAWMDEPDAQVPCNGCRLCCTGQLVLLFPDRGDDPAAYKTTERQTPYGPAYFLAQRPDGACVYLGAEGCTIYARRPAVCRAFDCGKWFARHTRAERRIAIRKGGDQQRQLFDQGRKIWEARLCP
jgi:Fe-S-cluster containining protein